MLTVRLDYSLSASWNRSAPRALAEAEEWVLRYRCFLGDVIFVIDDVDMSALWGWVPVLDFALALEWISQRLADGEASERFDYTESEATITFRRTGGQVEIDPSYAPGVARVGLTELRRETRGFLDRVLADLVGRHPDLAANELVIPHLPSEG